MSAGIPYTLLLRIKAIGFPTFRLLLYIIELNRAFFLARFPSSPFKNPVWYPFFRIFDFNRDTPNDKELKGTTGEPRWGVYRLFAYVGFI